MSAMSVLKQWAARGVAPLAAAACLVMSAGPAAAQRSNDIGVQMEQQYGVVGTNSREGRSMNAQLDEVVDRIVRAVNAQSARGDFRLRSAKILGGRSEEVNRVVNAFALPDGRIYVTLGLMRMLQNSPNPDDELAFVVGHEVTHVVEKHSEGQAKKSLPYYLGAIIVGAISKNNTIDAAAQYGAAAKASHFSRTDEYDADKGGLEAMHRAGYDPQASISMLRRLQAAGEERNKLLNGWFGSHPLTGNRVERVRDMISDLESGRRIRNEDEPRGARRFRR